MRGMKEERDRKEREREKGPVPGNFLQILAPGKGKGWRKNERGRCGEAGTGRRQGKRGRMLYRRL